MGTNRKAQYTFKTHFIKIPSISNQNPIKFIMKIVILLACVIVATAAFDDQLAEESRWRSDEGWGKGDLVGWNKGSSWNKGADLGWTKGGCIDCGKGWSNKGRWARSVDEEDDLTEEENKLRSHDGNSRGNVSGNHGGNGKKLGGHGRW